MERDFKSEKEYNNALETEVGTLRKRLEAMDGGFNSQERENEMQQELEHMRQQNEK
jgi:hypothetical protein